MRYPVSLRKFIMLLQFRGDFPPLHYAVVFLRVFTVPRAHNDHD
jgi:hypothetical protein